MAMLRMKLDRRKLGGSLFPPDAFDSATREKFHSR
jgi:hypothetical protein